jgi:hypothetical protein
MSENPGSLSWHAALAACLMLLGAAHTAAQPLPQPVVSPAFSRPEFLTRVDLHLTGCALSPDDRRFSWEARFGGSLDLLDYVVGRAGVAADYDVLLGDEFRIFDPNQGNYILEGFASARAGRTELVAIFHHVSRHFSDRPKRFAIAWNELGARILRQITVEDVTLDLDFEVGRAVQHSYVDYTWLSEARMQVRKPVNSRLAVFGRAAGQLYGVDQTRAGRARQKGGFVEGGVRLRGPGGTMELFGAIERRIDADPIDFRPRSWALAGFRLLSR